MYLEKIQILSGEVLDLNQKVKEKKIEDKKAKMEALKPDFAKATMRVSVSRAYAGGYELTVTVPTPSDFLKKEKQTGGLNEFVRQLHEFVNEKIGKWMGTPYIKKSPRARQGMIAVEAMWHFYDPFLAYSLGLELTEWMGSNQVVDRAEIAKRLLVAEKAWEEMNTFRKVANKKLQLRTKNKEEQNEIWKSEFMDTWVKLSKKWEEKGISYSRLHESKREKEQAVGEAMSYVTKIKKITASK